MKALILNGIKNKNNILLNSLTEGIHGELQKQKYIFDWVNLADKDIEYCTGCGYCGLKNPGRCAKQDDMVDIFPRMASSQLQVLISPISFGGYNSVLKKVLDRYSAMGLVTYTVYQGELHHPARYPNPVSFLSIGISNGSKNQEKTFRLVSDRIAICSFVKNSATIVINEDMTEKQVLNELKEGFASLGMVE